MNQRLTRRRFGQLAIASTTAVALGYLATKTSAQTTALSSNLVGVIASPRASAAPASTAAASVPTDEQSIVIQSATPTVSAAVAEPTSEIIVQSLNTTDTTNLRSSQVQRRTTGLVLNAETTDTVGPYKQLSGLASLSGGTLVVTSNSTRSSNKADPTRITIVGQKTLTVLGLNTEDKLESLVGTNDNQLFGLVVKKNGRTNVRLAEIDINTGQISFIFNLPPDERFSALTQCPDGTFYTTAIAPTGVTTLVKLDLNQKTFTPLPQPLSLNGSVWTNGLISLACSSSGELFGLGQRRYDITNYLFLVDANTGVMTQLREFKVANIAFRRP